MLRTVLIDLGRNENSWIVHVHNRLSVFCSSLSEVNTVIFLIIQTLKKNALTESLFPLVDQEKKPILQGMQFN